MRLSTTLSLLCFMMASREASGMWLFTNLLYAIGACHHEGPLCGPPECHGPLHRHIHSCSSDTADEYYDEETTYEELADADASAFDKDSSSGLPAASSRWTLLPLLIAAVVGAMFIGLYIWKKRHDRTVANKELQEELSGSDGEENLNGSVAKRLERVESGLGVTPLTRSPTSTSFVRADI